MAVGVYPLAFDSSMHFAGVAIGSVISLASGVLERVVDRAPLSRWWTLAAGLAWAGLAVIGLGLAVLALTPTSTPPADSAHSLAPGTGSWPLRPRATVETTPTSAPGEGPANDVSTVKETL
ncbi:hypothetical protein ASQ49_06145 [Acidipropionibacterium acidipropionici]|nr:hypothetical protein ASQ49_06145 [Acidipropionibacterium acidipropionici]APZ09319.1 hypothetical protein BWX38_08780 [Acidipropionibacterium acidipropionici]